MVNTRHRLFAVFVFSLLALHCNLEVGNPDTGEDAMSRNAPLTRIQLGLKSYLPCKNQPQDCVSLPFILPEEEYSLRFEMTEAKLFLQQAVLEPYAVQAISEPVNLLRGDFIAIEHELDTDLIFGASLAFDADAKRDMATYSISGVLLSPVGELKTQLPLTIVYKDPLLAQTAIAATEGTLRGLDFDAETWFDFSQSTANIRQLINHITSTACTQQTSARSCLQQSTVLAQHIAKQIARSLRPRQELRKNSSNGQMDNKGRLK